MKIFEVIVEHTVQSSILGKGESQEEIETHIPAVLGQLKNGVLIGIRERDDIDPEIMNNPEQAEAVAEALSQEETPKVH